MKKEFVRYLCCPECKSDLTVQETTGVNDSIKSGALLCQACQRSYPVINFIPRFVETKQLTGDEKNIAEAWGTQWKIFDELYTDYQEQFLEWVYPLTRDSFQNKVVLDAGCGMGRWFKVCLQYNCKLLIGVDISEAIDVALKNIGNDVADNYLLIQGDILHLPLKDTIFDVIYSIGVIHHLPDINKGLKELISKRKKDGIFYCWVYGKENNIIVSSLVNFLRNHIIKFIPFRVLYYLSFVMNLFLYPVVKLFYGKLQLKFLFYYGYFSWLAKYGFRHSHQVIFDQLVAPIARYLSKDEIITHLTASGIDNYEIMPRNNNSWRVIVQ